MASVSGFDPLFAELATIEGDRCKSVFVQPNNPSSSFLRRVARKFLPKSREALDGNHPGFFVEPRHALAAHEVLQFARANSAATVVMSVSENQLSREFSEAEVSVRKRTVLCVHQPPAYLKLHWRDFSVFNDLRAVVCVCNEQKAFFETICNSPVYAIKLGVRSDFFKPVATRALPSRRVLFVGHWLRDFDLLHRTMQLVWERDPGVMLDCVVPRHVRSHPALFRLAQHSQVHWHCNIDAEQLLNLYQNAAVLLQTLIDSTSNCAVVEAMACGLPIVATNVGGIIDYLPSSLGALCPVEDAQTHADMVLHWLASNDEQDVQARRQWVVNELCFSKIAKQLLESLASKTIA